MLGRRTYVLSTAVVSATQSTIAYLCSAKSVQLIHNYCEIHKIYEKIWYNFTYYLVLIINCNVLFFLETTQARSLYLVRPHRLISPSSQPSISESLRRTLPVYTINNFVFIYFNFLTCCTLPQSKVSRYSIFHYFLQIFIKFSTSVILNCCIPRFRIQFILISFITDLSITQVLFYSCVGTTTFLIRHH